MKPKSKKPKKDTYIFLRLDKATKRAIQYAALDADMNVQNFVLSCVAAKVKLPKDTKDGN